MAATEQLFNVRERKRFERHDIWERIAENGTISAAVMVICRHRRRHLRQYRCLRGHPSLFGDPAVCGSGAFDGWPHR